MTVFGWLVVFIAAMALAMLALAGLCGAIRREADADADRDNDDHPIA